MVAEPYYNEAGYERQKGTQQGHENSRMYNEMAILKLVLSMTRLMHNPPPIFKEEIKDHFTKYGERCVTKGPFFLPEKTFFRFFFAGFSPASKSGDKSR